MVDLWCGSDALQGLFECVDAGRADVGECIGVPGDRRGRDDSGLSGKDSAKVRGRDGAATKQFDVGLSAQPFEVGVNLNREATDDAGVGQAVHPPFHGRRGEADLGADLCEASPGIVPEQVDDCPIDGIHPATVRNNAVQSVTNGQE